jgi:hypothetical protein
MTVPTTSSVGANRPRAGSAETSEIIRAFNRIEPGQLFRTFRSAHGQFPYERIGGVFRTFNPAYSDTAFYVKTCLWAWVADRYDVGPKGTYAILYDYPEYPVSLMCGGIFVGWAKGEKTMRWGIFLTAAIIFRILPGDFPILLDKVAGTVEAIDRGELRIPEATPDEIRAYLGGIKRAVLPWWVEAGLITTVLRRAPTARKLWLALPRELCGDKGFGSPKELIYFLRKCERWENETVFRATERTFGRGNVGWLLEVAEGA